MTITAERTAVGHGWVRILKAKEFERQFGVCSYYQGKYKGLGDWETDLKKSTPYPNRKAARSNKLSDEVLRKVSTDERGKAIEIIPGR